MEFTKIRIMSPLASLNQARATVSRLAAGSVVALTLAWVPGVNSQEISPYLVGTNLWYGDADSGVIPDDNTFQKTQDLGVSLIRIGGAAFDYNPPSPSMMKDWVEKIRQYGAEPVVQVSQYKNAASAAEYVRYLNVEHDMKVKFWNVGNEPWLQRAQETEDFNNNIPAHEIEGYVKSLAQAMKEVDSSIQIFGPDMSDLRADYYDKLFGGENDISGKIPGTNLYYLDGMSWHRYPWGADFNANPEPSIEGAADLLERAKMARDIVDRVNQKHNRTGENAMEWGIGEFNSKRGTLVHTFANGQMFGQLYGYAMKYGATYAATWSMFESNGNKGATDFSMFDAQGRPRASAYHMGFVAQYMTGEYADGQTDDDKVVAYGAVDQDRVSVMVMNRGDAQLDYIVTLDGSLNRDAQLAVTIDADSAREYSDTIQPFSTQMLIFEGGTLKVISYSKADFEQGRSPTEDTIDVCGNQRPTIDPVEDLIVNKAEQTVSINLSGISDGDDCEQDVTVTAQSSDQTIVEVSDLDYTSCRARGSLELDLNATGDADIEVVVEDEGTALCQAATRAVLFNVKVVEALSVPGKIEAENFVEMEGFKVEMTNDGQSYLGFADNGDYTRYLIDVESAGRYKVDVNVASELNTAKIQLTDQQNSLLAEQTIDQTGSWQTFDIVTMEVDLEAGEQSLNLLISGAGVNIDWLELTAKTPQKEPDQGEKEPDNTTEEPSSNVNFGSGPVFKSSSSGGGLLSFVSLFGLMIFTVTRYFSRKNTVTV